MTYLYILHVRYADWIKDNKGRSAISWGQVKHVNSPQFIFRQVLAPLSAQSTLVRGDGRWHLGKRASLATGLGLPWWFAGHLFGWTVWMVSHAGPQSRGLMMLLRSDSYGNQCEFFICWSVIGRSDLSTNLGGQGENEYHTTSHGYSIYYILYIVYIPYFHDSWCIYHYISCFFPHILFSYVCKFDYPDQIRLQDRSGTNYITTGAGMALSHLALQKLLSCNTCTCRAPDAPDDMSLGTWFRNLGIEARLGW